MQHFNAVFMIMKGLTCPSKQNVGDRLKLLRYDIFNCNWVATRWQFFSTHTHTNNTENVTKQRRYRTTKMRRTTQKYIEKHKN